MRPRAFPVILFFVAITNGLFFFSDVPQVQAQTVTIYTQPDSSSEMLSQQPNFLNTWISAEIGNLVLGKDRLTITFTMKDPNASNAYGQPAGVALGTCPTCQNLQTYRFTSTDRMLLSDGLFHTFTVQTGTTTLGIADGETPIYITFFGLSQYHNSTHLKSNAAQTTPYLVIEGTPPQPPMIPPPPEGAVTVYTQSDKAGIMTNPQATFLNAYIDSASLGNLNLRQGKLYITFTMKDPNASNVYNTPQGICIQPASSINCGSRLQSYSFTAADRVLLADQAFHTFTVETGTTTSVYADGTRPVSIGFFGLSQYQYGTKIKSNVAQTIPYLIIQKSAPPDPCANGGCISNVLFLPGVLGSRLFEYEAICGNTLGEKERWVSASDCDHLRLALNTDGKSTYQLYTKEGENGVVDDAYSFNVYQSFMSELENWKQDGLMKDYTLIPYDWRLTLGDVLQNGATTTAGTLTYATDQGFTNSYIYKKLKELLATSRTGKVTIIAHSNGGLVAKALISRLKESGDPLADTIDNLILVSVPQTGTPDAVMGLLHGTDLGYGFIMGAERSRMLLNNMPSAYHLIPSTGYFTTEGAQITTPIATFDTSQATETFRNAYGSEINGATELRDFVLGAEGRATPAFSDIKNLAVGNPTLLAYAEAIYEQIGDNWTPSASTTVHQIAGWGEETLAGINYTTKTDRNCVLFIYKCTDTTSLTYKPFMIIDGDGTVVVPSALAMSTSTPNVKRWWVNLGAYNEPVFGFNRNHKDILEVPQLRTFISNILQGINVLPTYISETQPPTSNKKRLSFTLHSPLDLTAVDVNGNQISSATSTIPGARYKRYGEVQYVSLPAETVFTVELNGYASGSFDLDVALKQGNDTIATTTFAAIPTAITTIATISFSDGTITNASPLVVDYDGNGTADITLTTKEGEEVMYVPDTTPPEALITFATSTKSILFTGRDDITVTPVVTTNATSTTIVDEAGNTLTLRHTLKTQKNNTRYTYTLSSLTYATSTQTTIATKAIARYHYLEQKNKHNQVVFNAHLKTNTQNLVAVYNQKKNTTKITMLAKETEMGDGELEDIDDEKLPKNSKVKETLSGLVIPYLSTEKGKIIINY